MKYLYPSHNVFSFFAKAALVLLTTVSVGAANAQITTPELVFKNASLISGTKGADGAQYRFSTVQTGVDAIVTINGRSSTLVKLDSLDVVSTGWDKAFQPQVSYNNGNVTCAADWWMEFQIAFVKAGTTTPFTVSSFNVTALDIDGDGSRLNEYITMYKQTSYTTDAHTALTITSVKDDILTVLTSGKKFSGPVANSPGIDTSATSVMATNLYNNTNSFTVRAGAHTTGATDAGSRMNSFYFKSFTYPGSTVSFLPVTLIDWTATYNNNTVALKWTTTFEQNSSHFIIERSADGVEFTDIAMVIAAGNSGTPINYSYNDKIPAGNAGVLYYRLRSVDMDGQSKESDINIIRIGGSSNAVKITTYPNPVLSELRITVPAAWQDKAVVYQLLNTNGQVLKTYATSHAGQTEVMSMSALAQGMYIMKVTCGNETGVQSIMK